MKIEARNLVKSFAQNPILKGINLKIENSEILAIVGKSGSGKSTLLYALSGLDRITSGEILYDDKPISEFGVHEMHDFRNKNLGFVFQFHYLLPEFSILENVMMPAIKCGNKSSYLNKAKSLLEVVGLTDKMHKNVTLLSGGEQQRVAIARSLVMEPKVLFADEPTGNLDSQNGKIILSLFKRVNEEFGTTIIYVTHDMEYAKMAKRQIVIKDGQIA